MGVDGLTTFLRGLGGRRGMQPRVLGLEDGTAWITARHEVAGVCEPGGPVVGSEGGHAILYHAGSDGGEVWMDGATPAEGRSRMTILRLATLPCRAARSGRLRSTPTPCTRP